MKQVVNKFGNVVFRMGSVESRTDMVKLFGSTVRSKDCLLILLDPKNEMSAND